MPCFARKHQLQGNLLYHVYSRATSKNRIFEEEDDFAHFKSLLKRYIMKTALKIYHWVIMKTHYHLLLEIEVPEMLPSIMAGINRSYTAYFHKTYGTCGYLWQGRYKAQPIQKDSYMFACSRYIERNPVKGKIVTLPEEYPHSSCKYYVFDLDDSITTENPFFRSFGKTRIEMQNNYKKFLRNSNEEDEILFDSLEKPIGNDIFKSKLIKKRGLYIPRRNGRNRHSMFRP